MSNQANKLQKDEAQIVMWPKHNYTGQPIAFRTTVEEAEKARLAFNAYVTRKPVSGKTKPDPDSLETSRGIPDYEPINVISFNSYPDGSNIMSKNTFCLDSLMGLTVEQVGNMVQLPTLIDTKVFSGNRKGEH
jgi:hypothetical protein